MKVGGFGESSYRKLMRFSPSRKADAAINHRFQAI
jgi:hypothetical protein